MAKNIRYYSNSAFPLPQRRDANDALKAAGAGPARPGGFRRRGKAPTRKFTSNALADIALTLLGLAAMLTFA